jgi:hypothetical protein
VRYLRNSAEVEHLLVLQPVEIAQAVRDMSEGIGNHVVQAREGGLAVLGQLEGSKIWGVLAPATAQRCEPQLLRASLANPYQTSLG